MRLIKTYLIFLKQVNQFKLLFRSPVRGVSGVSIDTPRIFEISTTQSPILVAPSIKYLFDTPK